jgi:hypothetical protein
MKNEILGAFALFALMGMASADSKEINGVNYPIIGTDVVLINGIVYNVFADGGMMRPADSPAQATNSNMWICHNGGAFWEYIGGVVEGYTISGFVPYGLRMPPATPTWNC